MLLLPRNHSASFNPDPELTNLILTDYCSSDFTLHEIAARRGTNIWALITWLNRPDIAALLNTLESALTQHARLAALHHLPLATQVLAQIANTSSTPRPTS